MLQEQRVIVRYRQVLIANLFEIVENVTVLINQGPFKKYVIHKMAFFEPPPLCHISSFFFQDSLALCHSLKGEKLRHETEEDLHIWLLEHITLCQRRQKGSNCSFSLVVHPLLHTNTQILTNYAEKMVKLCFEACNIDVPNAPANSWICFY